MKTFVFALMLPFVARQGDGAPGAPAPGAPAPGAPAPGAPPACPPAKSCDGGVLCGAGIEIADKPCPTPGWCIAAGGLCPETCPPPVDLKCPPGIKPCRGGLDDDLCPLPGTCPTGDPPTCPDLAGVSRQGDGAPPPCPPPKSCDGVLCGAGVVIGQCATPGWCIAAGGICPETCPPPTDLKCPPGIKPCPGGLDDNLCPLTGTCPTGVPPTCPE